MIQPNSNHTATTSRRLTAGAAALAFLMSGTAASAAFDIFILRKGDGVEVTGNSMPHHIDHFSGSGAAVNLQNTWSAPSTDPNTRITMANFETYSQLTISPNGRFLSFTGRSSEVGASQGGDHVIGVFDLQTQTFDTSTRIAPAAIPHQSGGRGFRGAVTTNGTDLWFTGRNPGVYHATLGADSVTDVGRSFEFNMIGIHDDELYISRRAGGTHGIWRYDGLPTQGGEVEAVRFHTPGTGWDNNNGQYGTFSFIGDYLFVTTTHWDTADHIAVFKNDGPDVWVWMDGANQAVFDGITGMPHVTALDAGDHAQLFYTTHGGAENNSLYSVTFDYATETFGSAIHLADAGTGYTFSGIAVIPEPSTYALLFGLGVLGAALVIRRRRAKA